MKLDFEMNYERRWRGIYSENFFLKNKVIGWNLYFAANSDFQITISLQTNIGDLNIVNSVRWNYLSLKYQKFPSEGFKDIEI